MSMCRIVGFFEKFVIFLAFHAVNISLSYWGCAREHDRTYLSRKFRNAKDRNSSFRHVDMKDETGIGCDAPQLKTMLQLSGVQGRTPQ